MENTRKIELKKVAAVIILLIIAVVSVFVMSKYTTSAEFYEKTIQSLDEKKTTVMELTAASTAASAAITLIPGDTATPIADKLADLSSYFLIVVCALYLEKYLLTITGYAAFVILIPAACILLMPYVIFGSESCKHVAKKLAIFGIAIVLIIPASVKVSDLIEKTYDDSIQETLESATEATKEIEDAAEDQDENVLSGFLSKVKGGVSDITTGLETTLNNFIEALAVMLVTSCVIPIAVLLFFIWLLKILLGLDISLPKRPL